MMALFKEIVGAVTVAEVIEVPGFGCSATVTNHFLIDQDLDGAKVAAR
jgi:hypothetical protein